MSICCWQYEKTQHGVIKLRYSKWEEVAMPPYLYTYKPCTGAQLQFLRAVFNIQLYMLGCVLSSRMDEDDYEGRKEQKGINRAEEDGYGGPVHTRQWRSSFQAGRGQKDACGCHAALRTAPGGRGGRGTAGCCSAVWETLLPGEGA